MKICEFYRMCCVSVAFGIVAIFACSAQDAERFYIEDDVREQYQDMVRLIFNSESMDDNEKQMAFDSLRSMSNTQREWLFYSLDLERIRLLQLEINYQESLLALNHRYLSCINKSDAIVATALSGSPMEQTLLDGYLTIIGIRHYLRRAVQIAEKEIAQKMRELGEEVFSGRMEKARFEHAVWTRFLPQLRHEMSWEMLSPIYAEVFTQVIDEKHIPEMIAFHCSPAGRDYHRAAMATISLDDVDVVDAIKREMSPENFLAWHEFSTTAAMQQFQTRIEKFSLVEQYLMPRIESLVQTFLEHELDY